MARRPPASSDPIIELNRWQATGALLGLGVVVAVVFFAGVVVGRQTSAPLPPEVARIAEPAAPAPAGPTSLTERSRALATISPGTSGIHTDLAEPLREVVPSDPTEAARAETHRQILASRAAGMAHVEGARAPAPSAPVAVVAGAAGEAAATGYTLQVTVFEARSAAAGVATELKAQGHDARLREVSVNGQPRWSVEVGRFTKPAEAQTYQRRFERDSGYTAVLVPLQ